MSNEEKLDDETFFPILFPDAEKMNWVYGTEESKDVKKFSNVKFLQLMANIFFLDQYLLSDGQDFS